MNAVLYEVNNYAFDFLDGTNLLTSDKIVAIASVDGKEQAEYTDFSVDFKFSKSFDPAKNINLPSFALQVKMETSLVVLRAVCFMWMI